MNHWILWLVDLLVVFFLAISFFFSENIGAEFALPDLCSIDFCQELSLGGAIYGSDCMVVCNDWHSALVPMLIHAEKTTTGADAGCDWLGCILVTIVL